jgi:hypothetical protein
MGGNGWRWAGVGSAAVALALTVSAAQNAFRAGGDKAILVASGMVAANAALWWLVLFGLRARKRWSLHLGLGCAVLNLAQGLLATLSADAAARALAEQGLLVQDSPLTAALGWVPVAGSALFLLATFAIFRQARRTALGMVR